MHATKYTLQSSFPGFYGSETLHLLWRALLPLATIGVKLAECSILKTFLCVWHGRIQVCAKKFCLACKNNIVSHIPITAVAKGGT